MILDPTSAAIFIDGYKRLLLEVNREHAQSSGNLVQRLVAARSKMLRDPQRIDRVLAALESRSQAIDAEVVLAARTLQVQQWVYLRDTKRHSIFIDPSGKCAFGVVGLTDRISALVEGSGVYLEAGIVLYRRRFVCDGLVTRSVWLGPNYRREFNEMLRTIKANDQFFC